MNINEYPLWTAIVTPMDQNSKVDYDSFAKILKEQEDAQNGILVLGSTGESLNLDLDEKKEILNFVLKQSLSVPLMVGVGGVNLNTVSSWVDYINTLELHAYLMVTPLYAKPETKGQTAWFKTLMDKATKPVMLYNVPSRTGKSLSFDTIKSLANHPKLWAIKEASGSVDDFKQYTQAAPNARVYSGDDALLPAFTTHGAKGLVSVASNAWPKATRRYVEDTLGNKLSDQSKALWQECTNALFCVSNPIPVKRLMAEEKRITTPQLRLPLDAQDLESPSIVIEASQRVQNWFKEQD
jgi:4-hydroxy-tetrahydrodipicolinate synthase